MPEETKETLKESILKNAPNSSWRAMNFAIYVFSLCMLFLVTCVFILVLKTSIVTINLSTAKTAYFKDKAKVGRVSELLDKMEKVLTEPRLTAIKPTSTTAYNVETMPDIDESENLSFFSPPGPEPTAAPESSHAEEENSDFDPPVANERREPSLNPDIESLKQEIQELRKNEIPPSDAFQALN